LSVKVLVFGFLFLIFAKSKLPDLTSILIRQRIQVLQFFFYFPAWIWRETSRTTRINFASNGHGH